MSDDRTRDFFALYRDLRIEEQRKFYESRGKEYAAAARQAVNVRNTLLLVASLCGIAGQFTSEDWRSGLAITAAVSAAFAGVVTAYEALIGFPQLEKLYRDAATGLSRQSVKWDREGPDGDLAAVVSRTERILRQELGQWGQLVMDDETAPSPRPRV
jgi:hypothetical protein